METMAIYMHDTIITGEELKSFVIDVDTRDHFIDSVLYNSTSYIEEKTAEELRKEKDPVK